MATRSTRFRFVCQVQDEDDERYSFCGLLSINNALQVRDFLTPVMMRNHLIALERTHPGQDHGHPKFGAYSIQCLQVALNKKGFHLRYLNVVPTFRNVSKLKWPGKIVSSKIRSMIIIGMPHGQKSGFFHCVAKTTVADKPYLIDPDIHGHPACTEQVLSAKFRRIFAVYAIEPVICKNT